MLQALVEVIVTSEDAMGIQATILLAELLYMVRAPCFTFIATLDKVTSQWQYRFNLNLLRSLQKNIPGVFLPIFVINV